MPDTERSRVIAALNDALRTRFEGGQVLMTASVAALSEETRGEIINAVQKFDRWNEDSDPYGERDCAVIRIGAGLTVIAKIDYYDVRMKYASSDPTDPKVTKRVLTIMLSQDW